jgi:hypothetical protein
MFGQFARDGGAVEPDDPGEVDGVDEDGFDEDGVDVDGVDVELVAA